MFPKMSKQQEETFLIGGWEVGGTKITHLVDGEDNILHLYN